MTEAQMNAICNILSTQRNAALDQVAMKEAQVVELNEAIAKLTDQLAEAKRPVIPELFHDAEERN